MACNHDDLRFLVIVVNEIKQTRAMFLRHRYIQNNYTRWFVSKKVKIFSAIGGFSDLVSHIFSYVSHESTDATIIVGDN